MGDVTLTELGMKIDDVKVELEQMRKQQAELNGAIQELLETFRQLAQHMGVATEPYRRERKNTTPPAGFA